MTYYTSFCIPRLCPLLHTAACATGINHFPASLLHEMKEFIMVTVGRCEAFAVIYLVKLDWFINTVNIAILWGQWGAPCCVPLHILEESCVQCEGLGCSSSLLITHHITFPWIRSAKTVFWQIRSGSLIIISMYAGEFNRVFCWRILQSKVLHTGPNYLLFFYKVVPGCLEFKDSSLTVLGFTVQYIFLYWSMVFAFAWPSSCMTSYARQDLSIWNGWF